MHVDRTTDRVTPVRTFAIEVAIAMGVFTTLVFIGIFWRTVTLFQDSAREQASSYIDLIVNARSWNAGHGGVWVVKSPDVTSSPFLPKIGIEPDTSTISGTRFTLANPTAMTDEMSRIAAQTDGVQFHLTSLDPLNPDNSPDAWERRMLKGFESDPSQVSETADTARGRELRMMRPLLVEGACLTCHKKQGYHIGDVRGAISLTLPLTRMDEAVAVGGAGLFIVYLLVMGAVWIVGYRLVDRMANRVEQSERALHVLAITDPLTGISNRRAVLERLDEELARADRSGHAVGVLELDIDHFKRVNDGHGHAAGDKVLRSVASQIVTALREYDSAGRLGGEEFLVVAPEIDAESLLALAERLRSAIETRPVANSKGEISITTSVGATLSRPGDTTEDVFGRADEALYAAKTAGRNRVELA